MANFQSLFLILVILLALCWVICLLRAWVKIVIIKRVTPDDYFMLAAIISFTGYATSGLYGVLHGAKNVDQEILPEQAIVGLRAWFLCEALYVPLTLSCRTSVALFLLRIAVQRVHRRIIFGVIATLWIITIPLFMINIFQCRPVSYFWLQPTMPSQRGTCMDDHIVYAVAVAHSGISAILDWILGILPIVMLWKVRLNRRTKFTLCLLLGMGMFAGLALIVRITYAHPRKVTPSFLRDTIGLANWSVLEPGICIIAGCLGTLRPLFKRRRTSRRPARGRRVRKHRGLSFVIGPGYMSGEGVYTSSSHRMNSLRQPPPESANENRALEDVLVLDEEKEEIVHNTCTNRSCTDGIHNIDTPNSGDVPPGADVSPATDVQNGTDAQNSDCPTNPPSTRQSHVSRASVDSELSSRFASSSSLTVLRPPPYQNNRWLQHLHQQPVEEVSQSPPPLAPIIPPSVSPPIVQPHILVETMTQVDYDQAPPTVPTVASLPPSTEDTTEDPSPLVELPKSKTFHGVHSVQIMGQGSSKK